MRRKFYRIQIEPLFYAMVAKQLITNTPSNYRLLANVIKEEDKNAKTRSG